MKQRIFTRRQIIEEGTAVLKEAGIGEAALDAWYLLEYVTGINRAVYYGGPDKVMDSEQAEKYLKYIKMRRERIPLQHITGEQEFMGYPFFVNEHVLIPRQDTETLVEEALRTVQTIRTAGTVREKERADVRKDICSVKVLDMCTGSGCILLSMMKMCQGIEGDGCDISTEALQVARRNAERLNVEATWICSDLFEEFAAVRDGMIHQKYDMIVSNPPYIRSAEIENLQDEVRFHDPRIALDGKEDGLHFYRRIVRDSISYIKDGGHLLFEIGFDQGDAVAGLMEEYGYTDVTVKKDLAGLDRVVKGMYNEKVYPSGRVGAVQQDIETYGNKI